MVLRFAILVVPLCSALGCSGADEPRVTADVQGDPGAKPEPPPAIYDGEARDDDPCKAKGVTYTIDGYDVFVPAACDPNWKDTGDPPPPDDFVPEAGDPTLTPGHPS